MRPLMSYDEVGRAYLMEEQSFVPVKELWDKWEIHFLILASLFLQIFLFLTAGMRKHSSSRILSTILWLSYLSADSIAIFVLGRLSVRPSGPHHQLVLFWAPFVLVHLGGQDTLTAFSKQDNELWKRHLLSLVFHVVVAGYVVAKASWQDGRLRAAMALMFLSGSFKFAERTYCLYSASPETLRSDHRNKMLPGLQKLQQHDETAREEARRGMVETLELMSKGNIRGRRIDRGITHIMSVAHPLNKVRCILVGDELPGMLAKCLPSAQSCGAYKYVEALLEHYYRCLYTKNPLRELLYHRYRALFRSLGREPLRETFWHLFILSLFLLYTLFQHVSAPVALVLFMAAEMRDQIHASRADIIVSYILLIGAIVLDVSAATIFIFSNMSFKFREVIMRVANYIRPAWCGKKWSQEIAQYSMLNRHTAGMAPKLQWIGKHLGARVVHLLELIGVVDLPELTRIPIRTPIKEFVLNNLLIHGKSGKWDITSSRGQLALQEWMGGHEDQKSALSGKAVEKSIGSDVDFPTSVLIWHIATEICYYYKGGGTSDNSDKMENDKKVSRELSKYIMYLVFKCNVMLTSNSQLIHDNIHSEIASKLSDQFGNLGEKDIVMKIFSDTSTAEIQGNEEPGNDENAADNHVQKLLQGAEALYSPLLPRACNVAQGLIDINNESDRWELIAALWLEMLYYTAPRCGANFHYEHLTTGGEFITHVLVLMRSLGPFLPLPSVLWRG